MRPIFTTTRRATLGAIAAATLFAAAPASFAQAPA